MRELRPTCTPHPHWRHPHGGYGYGSLCVARPPPNATRSCGTQKQLCGGLYLATDDVITSVTVAGEDEVGDEGDEGDEEEEEEGGESGEGEEAGEGDDENEEDPSKMKARLLAETLNSLVSNVDGGFKALKAQLSARATDGAAQQLVRMKLLRERERLQERARSRD